MSVALDFVVVRWFVELEKGLRTRRFGCGSSTSALRRSEGTQTPSEDWLLYQTSASRHAPTTGA